MLTIREAPKSRTAIAGIYTDDKCTTDTRFVFSREFVEKVQTAIRRFRKTFAVDCEDDSVGVCVSRFGIFMLKDIKAMDQWHTCMEFLAQTEDAMNWAVSTCMKRFTIPEELSNGVTTEPRERLKCNQEAVASRRARDIV
ncbi:hypothetical protein L917_14011 [Phytophthora nicotianae]|uniref:Uncharacterized protein n=2 Tax=Phytophthora nicotianae TaxID=4792 RepID=V9EMQ4_PHYNI|nr:hypothetical protein F443_14693 [Phytophthora nicotianae P1569]ETL86571.1 hypothetical protein L917_14011 [Phytophthora nicotianae]ETM39750.1 hypothetical protein L914_14137 [Phytophthora nicotianae]